MRSAILPRVKIVFCECDKRRRRLGERRVFFPDEHQARGNRRFKWNKGEIVKRAAKSEAERDADARCGKHRFVVRQIARCRDNKTAALGRKPLSQLALHGFP